MICLIVLNDNTTVLQKTDFEGNYVYGHRYPGSLAYSWNTPKTQELRRTSDKGYVYVVSGGVMKIDSLGNNSWFSDLYPYTMDVIESEDHGFLVIGNGPLIGVSMAPWTNSQVGIVKTDSTGFTSDAWHQNFHLLRSIQAILFPSPLIPLNWEALLPIMQPFLMPRCSYLQAVWR